MEIPRLNGIIKQLEQGKNTFVSFAPADVNYTIAAATEPYDGLVFEMEHNPYDIATLRHCLQYLMNRRQIVESGSLAPAVTPMVRIPPNGIEMNQWIAKQVLDAGAYGIIWPHVSTVAEARSAVAACRYARPDSAPRLEPKGQRGDGPTNAARYWGLTAQEYYDRADVWPLDPKGEIVCAIMCEDVVGRRYLDASLDSNDEYHFTFLKDRSVVATMDIGKVPEHRRRPGLASHPLDLPPEATRLGFDTIVVEPIEGDGQYAIGHLLIEGDAATDTDLYAHRRQFNEPIAPR